ncbi:unnamed protein product [Penicillium salamii]|nr:unnamed protein product [Penicillium salamii]CAG8244117.1 unnamed protein product [Penicillium salamii]
MESVCRERRIVYVEGCLIHQVQICIVRKGILELQGYPHAVGNIIKIHLKRPDRLEATTGAIIIKFLEPLTLSSVMLIRMACSSLRSEGDMILKLFDRRFATQLREDEKIRSWAPDIEPEYRQFILDGGASEFVTQPNEGETPEGSTWSAAMDEIYLHDHLLDLYKTEVQVYSNLKDIKGTDIPKLLQSAILPIPYPGQTSSEYTDIPGILLQYIEGFPLTDIEEYTPRESWQAICEDAIRVINRIGDLGILNEDVKTRSFVVCEDAGNGFKVTMIDFALCKFRENYKDDYGWDKWKSIQDEEGAVGNSIVTASTKKMIETTETGTLPIDEPDFGDIVKNEEEELDLEELVEPWYRYKTDKENPLCPIFLGEMLNGRYLIDKLGFGGNSTVWMAFDIQDKKNVALKVMRPGEWAVNEIRIQDEIKKIQDPHLVTYIATFVLPRDHRVLVFPLMGPCIDPIDLKTIPIAIRMSAAHQLLKSLANLHEAGIIHRDLSERNCMWGMVSVDGLSRNAKYKALGRPLKQKIPSIVDLWKQGELVSPMKVPWELCTEKFYLGDFGLSKKISDPITPRGYPPIQYCSPDRLHNQEPHFACPLPEEWKGLYIYRGSGLDSWYYQSRNPNPEYSLASRIARFRPDADPVERQLVESIMLKVFTFHPEKRLSANELLCDPSFRALMNRYGCGNLEGRLE